MIDERMYGLGNEPSAIRELFAYGLKRKAEIGDDKVFDYSCPRRRRWPTPSRSS